MKYDLVIENTHRIFRPFYRIRVTQEIFTACKRIHFFRKCVAQKPNVPSAYAQEEELAELCKVVAEYGGIYTTHMRDEAAKSIQSLKEAISVAKKTGSWPFSFATSDTSFPSASGYCGAQIQGRQNWGMSKQTLEVIHQAIAEGVRISCDQYPYTASMTHLSVCAPPKYFTNGLSRICVV